MDTPTAPSSLVRETSLDEYRKDQDFAHAEEAEPAPGLTLYKRIPTRKKPTPGHDHRPQRLRGLQQLHDRCQSENNIAVVGKEQCVIGRHMHWIRVDAYYQGDRDNPKPTFSPCPACNARTRPAKWSARGRDQPFERRPER